MTEKFQKTNPTDIANMSTTTKQEQMYDDSASTASTLVNTNNEPRTTLTGQSIPPHQHDHHTMMMYSDAGMAFTNAGANLLPPGYTDTSMVRIPIKVSDYATQPASPKKRSFLSKLKHDNGVEIKVIAMSRGEYLKYWIKGDNGQFRPDVVEPPEGRAEWVRKQLELNDRWRAEGILKDGPDNRISSPGIIQAAALSSFSM